MKKFIYIFVASLMIISIYGCTSLGHSGRTEPQIELPLENIPDVIAVEGSGELSIAIELMLVSKGIQVIASPIVMSDGSSKPEASKFASRYVVKATSVDLDICLPEGSRQMHFHITVVDLLQNQRIFAMSGDYGCKDTIVKRFGSWFFSNIT